MKLSTKIVLTILLGSSIVAIALICRPKPPTQGECQMYGIEASLDAIMLSMGHTAAQRAWEIEKEGQDKLGKRRSVAVLKLVIEKHYSGDRLKRKSK